MDSNNPISPDPYSGAGNASANPGAPAQNPAGSTPGSAAVFSATTPATPAPKRRDFVSAPAGDIILTPGGAGHKKSKKPLILVLVLIVIIGITVAAVLLIKSPGGQKASNDSPAVAFNKFANYIIDGSTGNSFPAGEFNYNTYYAIESARDERNTAYFQQGSKLLDAAAESAKDNETISARLSTYKKRWDLIATFTGTIFNGYDTLTNYYITEGAEAAANRIREDYEKLNAVGDANAKIVAENYQKYSQNALARLQLATKYDCFKDSALYEECQEKIPYATVEDYKAHTEAVSARALGKQTIETITKSFVGEAWVIAEGYSQ